MQIIWHGMSCFEITALRAKGEHITILIDPLDEAASGVKMPKVAADIVLRTNNIYTAKNAKINSSAFLIDSPGEYEVKGVYIQGIASQLDADNSESSKKDKDTAKNFLNTIYSIETEDLQLAHLGNLQQAELTEEQISKIGNVDILMCPVGNGDGLGAKEALKIMSQIEPSIAIPMNYRIPGAKLKLTTLEEFIKEAGVGKIDPLPKLVIKKKEINAEEAKIIVLSL